MFWCWHCLFNLSEVKVINYTKTTKHEKKVFSYSIKLVFLLGCSEGIIEPKIKELDLSILVLPEEEFESVLNNVSDYLNSSSKRYGIEGSERSSNGDPELEEILNPMIDNGEVILDGVHDAIYESDFYNNMTTSEQESLHREIDQLSDQQLVELSLTFNAIYYADDIAPSEIGIDDIMSCLTVATGIVAL